MSKESQIEQKEIVKKILELNEKGLSRKEIGEIVHLSPSTVTYYIQRVKKIKNERDSKGRNTKFDRILSYINNSINKNKIQDAILYAKSHIDMKGISEKEREWLESFIKRAKKEQMKQAMKLFKKGKKPDEVFEIVGITINDSKLFYEIYKKKFTKSIESDEVEL